MSLVIAVDMDDVTVAFWEGVITTINRDFGVNLRSEDTQSWGQGHEMLNEAIGRDWWEWMEEHAWLWAEKFKPVSGAIGALEQLRRDGHFLEALTSKPPWAEWTVWAWLAKYRPPFHRVTLVPMEHSKVDYSDADVLIDDRDKNVIEWTATGKPAILFELPHNRGHELGDNQYRAKDWHEVLEVIDYLEEIHGKG